MGDLLKPLLQVYGPLGLLAILGYALFFLERKRYHKELERLRVENAHLNERLYEVSTLSIKADMEHSRAYERTESAFEGALNLLKELSDG